MTKRILALAATMLLSLGVLNRYFRRFGGSSAMNSLRLWTSAGRAFAFPRKFSEFYSVFRYAVVRNCVKNVPATAQIQLFAQHDSFIRIKNQILEDVESGRMTRTLIY